VVVAVVVPSKCVYKPQYHNRIWVYHSCL
jgi:hypothetical protein